MDNATNLDIENLLKLGKISEAHETLKKLLSEQYIDTVFPYYIQTCRWLFEPIKCDIGKQGDLGTCGPRTLLELAGLPAVIFPKQIYKEGEPIKVTQLRLCQLAREQLTPTDYNFELARWHEHRLLWKLGYRNMGSYSVSNLSSEDTKNLFDSRLQLATEVSPISSSRDFYKRFFDDRDTNYPSYINALSSLVESSEGADPDIAREFSLEYRTSYEKLLKAMYLRKIGQHEASAQIANELVSAYPLNGEVRLEAVKILDQPRTKDQAAKVVDGWSDWSVAAPEIVKACFFLAGEKNKMSFKYLRMQLVQACAENPYSKSLIKMLTLLCLLTFNISILLKLIARRIAIRNTISQLAYNVNEHI